jgi:hypothetical protein
MPLYWHVADEINEALSSSLKKDFFFLGKTFLMLGWL